MYSSSFKVMTSAPILIRVNFYVFDSKETMCQYSIYNYNSHVPRFILEVGETSIDSGDTWFFTYSTPCTFTEYGALDILCRRPPVGKKPENMYSTRNSVAVRRSDNSTFLNLRFHINTTNLFKISESIDSPQQKTFPFFGLSEYLLPVRIYSTGLTF